VGVDVRAVESSCPAPVLVLFNTSHLCWKAASSSLVLGSRADADAGCADTAESSGVEVSMPSVLGGMRSAGRSAGAGVRGAEVAMAVGV
jgi:hypothetical protein